MPAYRIAGFQIQSEIDLPGAARSVTTTVPDITLAYGAVPDTLAHAKLRGPNWQIGGDDFLFRIPGVARTLISGGRHTTIALEPGSAPADVAVFLVGTILGILLHQRGTIVLHASAVNVAGKAVLFCGPSGAGKSTMAASLVKRGHALVTDDLCAITCDGAVPLVHRGGGLKLWAAAIEALEFGDGRKRVLRPAIEKFAIDCDEAATESVPLGAIYVLQQWREPLAAGIERPNAVDAVRLVRNNAYRPRLVTLLDQQQIYLKAAARMVEKAGVFTLTRPFTFDAMASVHTWLEDHWRQLGFCDETKP